MGKTIYIDDGDALNIDRVIVNMPNTKWCKVLYSCDLIDEYEDKLKADKVAILTDLQLEIEELRLDRPLMSRGHECYGFEDKTPTEIRQECSDIIQQKIEQLEGGE